MPKNPLLETEFEERIYKDVKNLGKYIIKIYINRDFESFLKNNRNVSLIKQYLEKYPHIKIFSHRNDILKVVDVTDKIQQYQQTSVSSV